MARSPRTVELDSDGDEPDEAMSMAEAEQMWLDFEPVAYRLVTSIVWDGHAEDVVAEAAADWFEVVGAGLVDLRANPLAYLRTIVWSAAIDHRRRTKLDGQRRREARPTPHRPGPAEALTASVEHEAIWEALGGLSEEQRRVVLLVDVNGLKHREAAELLGVSRPAVTQMLSRARPELRVGYLTVLFGPAEGTCAAARDAIVAESAELAAAVAEHIDACDRCSACRDELSGFGLRLGALFPLGAVDAGLVRSSTTAEYPQSVEIEYEP